MKKSFITLVVAASLVAGSTAPAVAAPEKVYSLQCWEGQEGTLEFHNLRQVQYTGHGMYLIVPFHSIDGATTRYRQSEGEVCTIYESALKPVGNNTTLDGGSEKELQPSPTSVEGYQL